jgi:hypothetical protein
MKKELKKFLSRMYKLHKKHPDDPWNEIKIAHEYKKRKRTRTIVRGI